MVGGGSVWEISVPSAQFCCESKIAIKNCLLRWQTTEARRTTILQPVEQTPHSQKDRQEEKAEGYVPDEEIGRASCRERV